VVDALLESADPAGVSPVRLDSWTVHGGLNLQAAMSYGASNQPPTANAGPDQVLTDADGDNAESVALDGSGSRDADGTVASYEWREGSTMLASAAQTTVSLPVGTHLLTLVVSDDDGATASDGVVITVQPQPAVSDTVTILKAAYNGRRDQLVVEASSSDAPAAVLTVFDTTISSVQIGQLAYHPRKARYTGTFAVPVKPASISVMSSEGGSASSGVSGK